LSEATVPWGAPPRAQLDWKANATPHSPAFDDFYYSDQSGLAESRHVFLEGNQLPQRWAARPRFCIGETGFGTGLNFLASWDCWRRDPNASEHLHFLSVEKSPLRQDDLRRALAHWTELNELSEQLLNAYPPALPGRHRLEFAEGKVILDLIFGDALETLTELACEPHWQVDAWFLDGFTPARNPAMWGASLFERLARLSGEATTLATFTAATEVRRGLQSAGFTVHKRPGFGIKREMLVGSYHQARQPSPAPQTPWHAAPARRVKQRQALVIGGGLAGVSCATALARRNWRVTLLEANTLAAAASGNQQGVLYTRISHRDSALNSFSLHSFAYAVRYYRALLAQGLLQPDRDASFCGMMQLAKPGQEWPVALQATLASLPELVQALDTTQASVLSGLAQCPAGLFSPPPAGSALLPCASWHRLIRSSMCRPAWARCN
jgi:tRNA 5-methylaminomethyl-2-thiouridine biosynthesis bifunctional protein